MSRTSLVPLVLLGLALVACKRENKAESGTEPAAPKAKVRIVSVGSANTETVFALGKGADVVAVDTSSLFPEAATKLPQVGYQRALSAEGVLSVQPTLVLLPTEGGPPAVIDQLKQSGLTIEVIDAPATEEGSKARFERIAALTGADAAPVVKRFQEEVAAAKAEAAKTETTPKVLVLYARGPGTVQAFGQNTPADKLLGMAHAQNAAQGFEGNRPISAEAVVAWAPDYIVLPARGLDSLGGVEGVLEQPGLKETPAGKAGRVVPIDDLLLLGFGPRLGESVRTLSKAVHEK
ncbi:MAG: hemin ABC transporter substrate-binding protein [Proteobacteria bacterium]|nr:MAG: hemin ABC transporter substrate-binding protein [Pseudomonadota bacterium]